ncbi:major facilitator superfamily domain-containing protein [Fennellomyces sp. T-0311]|nr:major facilitator superfamily domain-containing protein [Fennellomyces sp. T-0311]
MSEKHEVAEKEQTAKVESLTEEGLTALDNDQPVKLVKSPEELKLVKKINLALMPLICAVLFIQFIDKSTLSYAAVMGLYEDTGISQSQFSWLGSIFYVGYLAFQIPNNFLLQRFPMSKYLGTILIVWGACLALTSLARNFQDLAGFRFLLGFFEGSTYPSIFLLLSTLYRRSEQSIWFGVLYICNAVSIAIGGFIGYGIGYMDGRRGLSAWKWAMIIWGCLTTFIGVLFFFLLPDRPKSRWFRLTPKEEKIVDERTRDNAVVQNREYKISHVYEAIREPRLYCYILISFFLNLQNGTMTIFANQFIVDMGFTRLESILLNIPNGAAIIIIIACVIFLSQRYNDVNYVGALFSIVSMIGALLLCTIPGGGPKLIGLYLSATSPPGAMLNTSISHNVAGYTKKIFYNGANMVAYCIGNFVGPLMMVEHTAPRYIGGMSGYIVADFLAALLFVYLRWSYNRENKRRAQLIKEGQVPPPAENREELDLTDQEDLNFVYRL